MTKEPFSTIPDLSLDELIGDYKEAHPNAGIRYIRGYLTQQGMRIQRERIVNSLSRVNSVAMVILQRKQQQISSLNIWDLSSSSYSERNMV